MQRSSGGRRWNGPSDYFAANFSRYDTVDELIEAMVSQGFDPDLAMEVQTVSPIAFGRMLFEQRGIPCSPTIIRARRDGRVETDVPLMSIRPTPGRVRWGFSCRKR
jgi:hypothetical protein